MIKKVIDNSCYRLIGLELVNIAEIETRGNRPHVYELQGHARLIIFSSYKLPHSIHAYIILWNVK